jgi:hypothetical protein
MYIWPQLGWHPVVAGQQTFTNKNEDMISTIITNKMYRKLLHSVKHDIAQLQLTYFDLTEWVNLCDVVRASDTQTDQQLCAAWTAVPIKLHIR